MKLIATTLMMTFLCLISVQAQESISGTVVDAEGGKPLAGVYVCAFSGDLMVTAAFTDDNGRFSLSRYQKRPDRLSASFLGYALTETVLSQGQNSVLISMKRQNLELKEVSVTAPPIVKENDTTSYYVEAFRRDEDLTLKDVLVKLPGVEVNSKGTILHRGKPINKFYVEGIDMLAGRYSLVTENLDPRKIARIEVIENHQPVKALKGLTFSDRSAVNIVLKSDSKGEWLFSGDAAGGYMEDTSALAEGRLWLANFGKSRQSMMMLKGNNTGKTITDELQRHSYLGRNGIIINMPGTLDTDFDGAFNLSRTMQNFPDEYYFDNISTVLSLNHVSINSGGTQFRMGLQGAAERWKESEVSSQRYVFEDGTTMEIADTDDITDDKLYLDAGLEIESNTDRAFINNALAVSGQLRRHTSTTGTRSGARDQSYRLPSFKVSNQITGTVRTGSRAALSIFSDTRATVNNHRFTLDGTTEQQADYTDLRTFNTVSSIFIAGRTRIDVKGGLDMGYYRRFTELTGIPSWMEEALADSSSNRLQMFSGALTADISTGWSWSGLSLRIDLPMSIRYVKIWNDIGVTDRLFPGITPTVNLTWMIFSDLKASVSGSYSLTDDARADMFMTGYVLRSYRNAVRAGIVPRRKRYSVNINLDYSSLLSRFSASLTGGYDNSSYSTASSGLYYDDLTLTGMVDRLSVNGSLYGKAKVKKWFGVNKLVLDAGGGYRIDSHSMFLQGYDSEYRTEVWEAEAAVELRPYYWLELTASFKYSRTRFLEDERDPVQSYLTEGRLVLSPFRNFSVSGSVYHLYQQIPGSAVTNTPLLKAGAEYRFKKFRIFLECTNILNTSEFRRESLGDYFTWYTSFRMRPRSYLLGLRMSF